METNVGENDDDPHRPVEVPVDGDDDGVTEDEGDCDDSDPDAGPAGYPSFDERCDGIDNDCDTLVDEDECGRTDVFYQTLQLDVLFVIDTSESMLPYIARAAGGAADFLPHLVGPDFDTHIGVVTMASSDPSSLGRLVSVDGRNFIEGDDDKFNGEAARQWLTRALTENPVTAAAPTGRAAADAALSNAPQGLDQQWNQGFLHKGGSLQLVFLSDREDATVSPNVPGFIETLSALKGGLTNVAIHSITQLDTTGCDGQDAALTSYASLAGNTFTGTTLSVCELDYGPYLSAVGQHAAIEGLDTEFTLAFPAQTDSVSVVLKLEGVFEYALAPDVDFTLASGGRTLILLDNPPPAGTTITVDYDQQPPQ